MSHSILVTGAAGGQQGSTGRHIATLLIERMVGGCPMMYCKPVDFGHRCMRWLLRFGGKVPG